MHEANWAGIAAVATLYLVFFVVGWRASKRLKLGTASELLVAGRAMPFWMATVTMAATWIDGGYLLGTAEGVMTSIASGWQGGVCFGLSLILGGFFFARRMRQLQFVTLVDPFAARFGKHWSAVLSLPAMFGEVFWSAELLVAIGATFGVMLGINLTTAIIVSAAVVTGYTLLGGMWSVGYTDSVQFMLIPIGLMLALPLALARPVGLSPAGASTLPPRDRRPGGCRQPKPTAIGPPRGSSGGGTCRSCLCWVAFRGTATSNAFRPVKLRSRLNGIRSSRAC